MLAAALPFVGLKTWRGSQKASVRPVCRIDGGAASERSSPGTSLGSSGISFVAFAWAAWPALMPSVRPALRVDPAE